MIKKKFPQIKYFLEWESGVELPFHGIALGSEATDEPTRKKEVKEISIKALYSEIEEEIKVFLLSVKMG